METTLGGQFAVAKALNDVVTYLRLASAAVNYFSEVLNLVTV